MTDLGAKRQLRMPIEELETLGGGADLDGRLLLAPAGLRLLNIREVGAELKRDLARQPAPGSIDDRERDAELRDADAIEESDVQRPFGNSMSVRALLIASLAGSAAAGFRDLRVHERQCERGGVDRRGITQPGAFAVDLQTERA